MNVTSNLRVEEQAKRETTIKQAKPYRFLGWLSLQTVKREGTFSSEKSVDFHRTV
jgi:hypothetical protein